MTSSSNIGVIIGFQECPRCDGPVLRHAVTVDDNDLCIICGWRRVNVPRWIQEQVSTRLGQDTVEDSFQRSRYRKATGKAPLSGWERKIRRKAEDRRRLGEAGREG